jgi:hypothetical protein
VKSNINPGKDEHLPIRKAKRKKSKPALETVALSMFQYNTTSRISA